MQKIYNINELKDLQHLSTIEFFNLPSKISKQSYQKHFAEKYNEFFIKDLSLFQMRRYYNDKVFAFYIDNFESIKNDNNIFFNYIDTLDTNTKKSLTRNTIKSTYNEVYDNYIKIIEEKQNKDIKFKNNEKFYMNGIIKGSSFNNKKQIEEHIIHHLGSDAIIDYSDGCKLSYIIKKYFYKEKINYRCSTCFKPIDAHNKEFKECINCYKTNKQSRENEKRANYILSNIPEHLTFIDGNFNSSNFYDEKYKVYCVKCRNEQYYTFKSNKRILKCPICDRTQKINYRINNIFSNVFEVNTKRFISPLEIDLINHSNKLCIEYNGLMFHSHGISEHTKFNNPVVDSKYHLRKTELVEEKEYQLFHIFENEWLDEKKQKIWISIINTELGLSESINLVNCTLIDELDCSTVSEFHEINNLEGNCESEVNIGLIYNNLLVSVMSFIKINPNDEWKIVRFTNKIGYTIDSASKLLNYFEETYKPKTLLVSTNRRYCQGEFYKELGFKFVRNTEPNSFYFKPNDAILHSSSNYKECTLEDMFNNGYRIIYDCGNSIFKKEYNL